MMLGKVHQWFQDGKWLRTAGPWWQRGGGCLTSACWRAHTCTKSVPLPLVLGLASAVEETWTISHSALNKDKAPCRDGFRWVQTSHLGWRHMMCGHRATPGKTPPASWKSHGWDSCCVCFLQLPLENNKRFTARQARSLTLSYPLLTTLERRADVNLRCLSKLKNGSPER